MIQWLDRISQTDSSSLTSSDRETQSTPVVHVDQGSQSDTLAAAEAGTQTDLEVADAEVQTLAAAAEYRWARIFRVLRRLSFLRRLRPNIADYVREFDGVYPER